MKSIATPLLLLVMLACCAVAAHGTEYGQALTLEATTPIASVLADVDAFEGKRVQVSGTVTEVCPRRGCWMSVRDGEHAIRIKVEDGVIVFPAKARTHTARAEGVVEVLELDRERYVSWMTHLAEERGETFDPESVGDGPYRVVQIRGEGAEIDL